ncbi:MAG: response regulator transcription factor [Anaerolineales bacterium]
MNQGGHILIIDDEASLRQTMARILLRAGFEVTTVSSGKETLSIINEHTFDLIYLDIRMPDINGLEVLKTIHEQSPELPVILFTAQPDLHSAVEALRGGAIDYLMKPIKPEILIERTRNIIGEQQKKKRKREIQRQMEELQAELESLDGMETSERKTGQLVDPTSDRFIKRGALTLDLHTHRVLVNNQNVNLAPTSFDYLLVLARHSPQTVDFQTLVAEAQGYETDAREAQELTKWHIHNIRQAIETDTNNTIHVINIRGSGYRLVTD